MKISDLKVGDEVGIAKYAGYLDGPGDPIRSVGLGTVVKANKQVVVVKRHRDGHEGKFSVKFGYLIYSNGGYTDEVFLEEAETQRRRDDVEGRAKREAEVKELLKSISVDAERNRPLSVIGHVAKLQQVMDVTA